MEMSRDRLTIAVLGAGHGGQAMAGHLAVMGHTVRLFNRTPNKLSPITNNGGINLSGEVNGFGPIETATGEIAEAISGADLIMLVVPATAHRYMAEIAAPYLTDGQVIVLHPGRTFGAMEFSQVIKEKGCNAQVDIAEAQTFIYAARLMNPAQVHIFRIKNTIPVAAFPAYRTPAVLKVLRSVYPQFVPGDNTLKTSLDNIGAIFHPAITLLNAGRIESTKGDFEYYMEGITPSTALILERMDAERVEVAAALGIRAMPAREWLYVAYDAAGKSLYEAVQNNFGYRGIKAPTTVNHRYIWEDVPTSLVPIASLGHLLGVPTPVIDSIIGMCSTVLDTDFWNSGRTVDKVGLTGLTVREINRVVMEGVV